MRACTEPEGARVSVVPVGTVGKDGGEACTKTSMNHAPTVVKNTKTLAFVCFRRTAPVP